MDYFVALGCQRMCRLTDTKVRGFMVTETNNEACAQLQLVLHALLSCARVTSLSSVGPFLIDFHKANCGR